MSHNALSIKTILLFFVVVIVLTLIFAITMFIKKHNRLQTQLTNYQLQQTVAEFALQLDKEIELAKQNVQRLKSYVSILYTGGGVTSDNLMDFMAENLQFENNHYSSFIVLKPNKDQQSDKSQGKLLLVYKNMAWRDDKKEYNKPSDMLQKSSNDPSDGNDLIQYCSDQNKRDVERQSPLIYLDVQHTNRYLFSLCQELSQKQTIEGVVGISILAETFFGEIENQKLGLTGGIIIVSEKGMLLSKIGIEGSPQLDFLNVTERQSFNLYSNSIKQPFWKDILNQDVPYREVKNSDGQLYTLSSKKLRTLPWTLVSYQKTAELKQDKPFGISDFLVLAALVLLLLGLMTLVLFKTLISPLSNLIFRTEKLARYPGETLKIAPESVVELRTLANVFMLMAAKVIKLNSERVECLKQLQASRLALAKRTRQFEKCQDDLAKVKVEKQNSRAETQKARLQIQKARVEIQKHKLEAKRAKMHSQAANQAKTQFLANMSRELRTPMNAVIGYTEMLQEDAKERGHEYFLADLQKIHGAGYHLLDLINNLFDMSKIQSSQMDLYIDTFDIAPMIQDVVTTITPLLEKRANILKVDCDSALGTMSQDLSKVRQNLLNLLSNANKFSKQTTILLAVLRETVDGIDWILFRITDQGIGMTDDQVQNLFQAFVPVDASKPTRKYGGSSGLGLAVTKQFCEIMGGEIFVKSKIGQGSTFTMRLPAQVNPTNVNG
jgi:signal transduction histidine kinase